MAQLSDAQVLELCEARLPDTIAARLTELLDKRQNDETDETEAAELAALIHTYSSLWLRQSEALAEAVRRGLRPPLQP
jgi:hypothetical protein